jgi:hypothetical protein
MPTSRSTLGPGSACRASVGVSTVLPFSDFGMKSPCAPQPIGSGGIGSPGGRLTIWAVLSGRRETLRCGDRPPQSSSDLNPWSRNFESDNAGLAPTASQKKMRSPVTPMEDAVGCRACFRILSSATAAPPKSRARARACGRTITSTDIERHPPDFIAPMKSSPAIVRREPPDSPACFLSGNHSGGCHGLFH